MKVNSRIQLNLVGGETMYNSDIKLFDNLVLPIFWIEIVSYPKSFKWSFIDKNFI